MRVIRGILAAVGLAAVGLVTFLEAGTPAIAADQTVLLALDNLFCRSCPYIVRQTLLSVPGVHFAEVSYEDKTALVVFDDSQTDAATLTEATARNGFPSRLLPQ